MYDDVLDLYQEGSIVGECPIFIEFKGELAIDEGGVQRDTHVCILLFGNRRARNYLRVQPF